MGTAILTAWILAEPPAAASLKAIDSAQDLLGKILHSFSHLEDHCISDLILTDSFTLAVILEYNEKVESADVMSVGLSTAL